jgi:hypothetical protein
MVMYVNKFLRKTVCRRAYGASAAHAEIKGT